MTQDPTISSRPNPFPRTAVANFAARGGVSIPTASSAQASQAISSYLASPVQGVTAGKTVAIVGEFGTGKTHLALEMLHELEVATQGNSTVLYVDVPGDSFLQLYRDRFLVQIDRLELRRRVTAYYANIVADELAQSEFTSRAAVLVRSGAMKPDQAVDRFGLGATKLASQLAARLKDVTQQPDFAAALTLFLRPEFETAVWQWLSASPPDIALVERGVSRSIETDVDALEAMSVIALLYGQSGRRFALVIDELEKILVPLAGVDGGDSVLLALKRLMEKFASTGALLILCGLPDYFDLLPADTKQRIALVIRPTRLTGEDTQRFIDESQRRLGAASGGLAPFSVDSAKYVASIAGGNPRRIIRLCYLLYRASHERGVPVTRALVREVAKEQYEVTSSDEIQAELVNIFDRHGWRFEREKLLIKSKGGRIDFWLPYGSNGSGCAVLIVPSLLDEREGSQVLARSERLMKGAVIGDTVQVFIVVNGRVADDVAQMLAGAPMRIFEFDDGHFVDGFASALEGTLQRIERSDNAVSMVQILDRLDQLSRQVSTVSRNLEQFAASIGRPQLEFAAEAGLRRLFVSLSDQGGRISDDYPLVRSEFDRVRAELSYLRATLGSRGFESDLFIDDPNVVIAILAQLEKLVLRFEEDVNSYLLVSGQGHRFPGVERRESLGHVCEAADVAFGRFLDTDWRPVEQSFIGKDSSRKHVMELRDAVLMLPRSVYERVRDLNL